MESKIEVIKALADKTRFNILKLLLEQNYCVGALSKKLNISEAAISQHLKILREVELVKGEKRGYFTHYQVNGEILKKLASDLNKLGDSCKKAGVSNCQHKKDPNHCSKDCHEEINKE